MLTLRQRFDTFGDGYAPVTLGAPKNVQDVDYEAFKNTKEQKSDKLAAKWQHKMFMKRHKVDDKKFLNIPELRLETPLIITT